MAKFQTSYNYKHSCQKREVGKVISQPDQVNTDMRTILLRAANGIAPPPPRRPVFNENHELKDLKSYDLVDIQQIKQSQASRITTFKKSLDEENRKKVQKSATNVQAGKSEDTTTEPSGD